VSASVWPRGAKGSAPGASRWALRTKHSGRRAPGYVIRERGCSCALNNWDPHATRLPIFAAQCAILRASWP
jgi:hypothetical protein